MSVFQSGIKKNFFPQFFICSCLSILLVLSLSFAITTGCGPKEPEENGPPNGEPDDQNTVTESIGVEGGTISLDGCWISFPAEALDSETEITITIEDDTPEGFMPFSKSCIFEPSDLELSRPVSVKLSFQAVEGLASLFHAPGDSERFERIGGATDGNWIGARISRLGSFFVGHGTDFEEIMNMDCAGTIPIGYRAYPDFSSVAMHFWTEDCDGRPLISSAVPGFSIRENASSVASNKVTDLPVTSKIALVSLLIDASSPMQTQLSDITDSIEAFMDEMIELNLPFRLSIELFSDKEESIVWQPHMLPDESFTEKLSEIVFDMPSPTQNPNLHGAVISALNRLNEERIQVETNNNDGAFTSGYIVILSSKADGAGIASLDEAAEAVTASRTGEGIRFLGVGLHGSDYDPISLAALAPDGIVTGRSTDFEREMRFTANQIAAFFSSTHLLAYCSSQTDGTHEASVEIDGIDTPDAASFMFDAHGFGAECSPSILNEACESMECGGPGCGACDDRTSECDPSTNTCQSFCERPVYCAEDTFTNPRGYEQTCPPSDTNTRCGEVCVDITSNIYHCGECWNDCDDGFICVDRECVCPEGLTDCDGICRDTLNDVNFCGNCNTACPQGATCEEGDCVCPGDNPEICDGICRDLAADPLNCGSCGHTCSEEMMTSCNYSECGGPRWIQTPMPNPAGQSLPNPADYNVSGDTVTDNVTGLTWQRHAVTESFTWEEAHDYCRQLSVGGISNWRIPSRIELISLVDFSSSSPAIDVQAFPDTPADWTWTSSKHATAANQAWAVDFSTGDTGTILSSVRGYARCVRN